MQNLPGVDRDKHPNWRRKLPVDLEKFETDIAYIRNIRAIRRREVIGTRLKEKAFPFWKGLFSAPITSAFYLR